METHDRNQFENPKNDLFFMKKADMEVRKTLPEIAPEQKYFTDKRRKKLMAAFDKRASANRDLEFKKVAGLAAVAMILISFPLFVFLNINKNSSAKTNTRYDTPVSRSYYNPKIKINAQKSVNPGNDLRGIGRSIPLKHLQNRSSGRTILVNSEGVRIPAENSLYDKKYNSRWW